MSKLSRRIFISYRRSDTPGHAGWLHHILEEHYGRSSVFRDLDSIEPGQHFPTRVAQTIATCTDVFALIGQTWLVRGSSGRARLFEPDDWVRLELETAMQRDLRIVPLLIGNAVVPPPQALPASLVGIAERQSYGLRDAHFAEDVRNVISRVDCTSDTEREYLGAARRRREDRFGELYTLFADRNENDSFTVRSVPWRRAENLRPQFDALINILEPDEEVADVVLANLPPVGSWSEDTLRGTLLTMQGALGLLALTPNA